MNSFNKTEASIFYMHTFLPKHFPCYHIDLTYYRWCLVLVWRLQNYAPYYIIMLLFLSVPLGSCIIFCLHLKKEFADALHGGYVMACFKTIDEQLQLNRASYCLDADYASTFHCVAITRYFLNKKCVQNYCCVVYFSYTFDVQ